MRNYNKSGLLIATLGLAGFTQIANAVTFPTSAGLFLYDETTGQTAFAAASGAFGIATFSGTVGDYNIDVSATGKTIAGGAFPSLDLDVASADTSTPGDKLDVYYSNGSFGPSSAAFVLSTSGPSDGGPIVSTAYWGTSVFSTANQLGQINPDPGAVSGTLNTVGASYFLTLGDVITGDETSVDTKFSTIPEPSTVVAAALMLLPLGIGAARCLRKDRIA